MGKRKKQAERHVVLEELLSYINHDGSGVGAGVACDKAEYIFDVQEEQIDKLFEQRTDAREKVQQLETDYESVLMDYERTDAKLTEALSQVEDLELLFAKAELQLNVVNEQVDEILEDAHIQARHVSEVKANSKVLNAQLDSAHDQIISLSKELDVHDRITSAMIKQFNLGACLNVPMNQQGDKWHEVSSRIKWEYANREEDDYSVIVVDNLEDAIHVKNDMWYPLNIRPMGIEAESVDVSNDAEFIRWCSSMLKRSPCDSVGIREAGEIVEKYDMADDALDLSNHSITVENLPDAIDGAYAIGYPIAISARGVTESEGYVCYNEREFILMAYDMLVSSLDTTIILKQYTGESIEAKMRNTMQNIQRAAEACCDDGGDTVLDDIRKRHEEERRGQTNFEELMDVNDITTEYDDYYFTEGLDTMDKLHYIEDSNVIFNPIYNIHYCNAGVGIIFYDPTKDTGNFRDALTVHKYYENFEDCVDAEYQRLKNREETTKMDDAEEKNFNALCRSIYEEYHNATYAGDFDPWIDNGQLVDVVDIVFKRSGVGFNLSGSDNIYDLMRDYVLEYGSSKYWMQNNEDS